MSYGSSSPTLPSTPCQKMETQEPSLSCSSTYTMIKQIGTGGYGKVSLNFLSYWILHFRFSCLVSQSHLQMIRPAHSDKVLLHIFSLIPCLWFLVEDLWFQLLCVFVCVCVCARVCVCVCVSVCLCVCLCVSCHLSHNYDPWIAGSTVTIAPVGQIMFGDTLLLIITRLISVSYSFTSFSIE